MKFLDFNQYRRDETSVSPLLLQELKSELCMYGNIIILKNFPYENNKELVALSLGLGSPHPPGSKESGKLEDHFIYNVKIKLEATADDLGNIIYSTTSHDFHCHTDGSNRPQPYDLVLLHCIKPDQEGGETVLFEVDEVINRLSKEEITLLSRPIYPFYFGNAPILTQVNRRYEIRYNRRDIDFYAKSRGVGIPPLCRKAMDNLDEVIDFSKTNKRLLLDKGDCLIINNKRVLHGRTSFAQTSNRLLNRVRLFALPEPVFH